MLQLRCKRVIGIIGSSMVEVHFELILNGTSTNQSAVFTLQPDYCEVGEMLDLTAHDFVELGPTRFVA